MKKYNGMNGWGKILSMKMTKKKSGGKKYLSIKIGCPNRIYGNVRMFLNVWNEDKAIEVEEKFNERDFVNIRGFMGQYSGRHDTTKTSVSAFKIEPWDPEDDQHSKNRMTFVLVGRVVSFRDGRTEGQAEISIDDKQSPLKVCIPQDLAIDIKEGGFFRIKGAMMIEEDDHGDLVKPLRPVAEKVEEVEEDVGTEAEEEGKDDKPDDDIPF
ncbi:MAG: hypothetical protein KAV87_20955 [Desulfobacteraceae bacterium]|nr:hypothetical protein [Desulfobacteraceae bacterium]